MCDTPHVASAAIALLQPAPSGADSVGQVLAPTKVAEPAPLSIRRQVRPRGLAPWHGYAISMCFAPEVDLLGGAAIAAIGFDTLRNVDHPSVRPLAALPVVFGLHQVIEAFAWWGLDGRLPESVGNGAAWLYLAVAFGLLPWFVPWVVRWLEPDRRRRSYASTLVFLGVLVSIYLMVPVIRGPIEVTDGGLYLSYSVSLTFGGAATALYVGTTCGALLLSSDRYLILYGLVNLVAVIVLATLTVTGVISLWCVWAAITSVAIAVHLRRSDEQRHRFGVVALSP